MFITAGHYQIQVTDQDLLLIPMALTIVADYARVIVNLTDITARY